MKQLCLIALLVSGCAPLPLAAQSALPAAPTPDITLAIQSAPMQAAPAPPNIAPSAPAPGNGQDLTRAQAEQLAIRDNPRITASKLLALAQHQVVREARAADLPTLTGNVSAVDAEDGTRISAGSLTASRLITHAGAGGNLTQLITDFGRTHNLILSQKLSEEASKANALATAQDIVLATDTAFYNALTAQSVLQVALQTVNTRQATQTQINQMTVNNLRSTLDLSFANVNLSQAQLLQLDAQNNADAAMAQLDAVLGLDHTVVYHLVDDTAPIAPPPPTYDALVQQALQQRPDLQALNYDQQSSQKYARAEWEQMLPSISAAGTGGSVPVRNDQYYTANNWGAAGVNLNIPIFNGFLYSSQAKEAKFRATAASENARDLRDLIVRDVHTAWLDANTAYQRVGVTAQLVNEANMGFNLAQARYKLGLSSIVELSQAELQQTTAQIDNTEAEYGYRLSLANLNYQIGTMP
jgi:outer membrane protein